MVATILSSPLFVEGILPFLLVFAVVFAVLQKSEILGKGKKQVDAIVALAVGLIVLAFGQAVGLMVQLSAFLAVGLVILLVLMLLVGMFSQEGKFNDAFPSWLQKSVIAVIAVSVVIAVLYITGGWKWLMDKAFASGSGSGVLANIVFIVGIIIAVVIVGWKGKDSEEKGSAK